MILGKGRTSGILSNKMNILFQNFGITRSKWKMNLICSSLLLLRVLAVKYKKN